VAAALDRAEVGGDVGVRADAVDADDAMAVGLQPQHRGCADPRGRAGDDDGAHAASSVNQN
jgi:hypothetical protein